VVIDGWDYYVSDNHAVSGDFALYAGHVTKKLVDTEWTTGDKKVIATNNPSIDIPKVVDEVEELAEKIIPNLIRRQYVKIGFIAGYNKSQKTHPFSEEDMIEFAEWLTLNTNSTSIHGEYIYKNVRRVTKELIQIWKEQRTKTLYYE
jgi:hypothetical protein